MTAATSASAQVEVAVDPATAFAAFTDEMDLWWLRTPITFYDSARAVARKVEPGVGGRLLEVYDEAAGDVLVLGHITVWEPGAHLAWRRGRRRGRRRLLRAHGVGDPCPGRGRLLPGGDPARTGGFSYARTLDPWFLDWCARRDTAPACRRRSPAWPSSCTTPSPSPRPGGWPTPSASTSPASCPTRARTPAGSSSTSATAPSWCCRPRARLPRGAPYPRALGVRRRPRRPLRPRRGRRRPHRGGHPQLRLPGLHRRRPGGPPLELRPGPPDHALARQDPWPRE